MSQPTNVAVAERSNQTPSTQDTKALAALFATHGVRDVECIFPDISGYPRGKLMPIQFDRLFGKCLQVQAIVGANDDPGLSCYHHAMELIDQGIADAKTIITHRFPLERVMDAYELQRTRDEGAVKIVVETK